MNIVQTRLGNKNNTPTKKRPHTQTTNDMENFNNSF